MNVARTSLLHSKLIDLIEGARLVPPQWLCEEIGPVASVRLL